MYKVLIADDEPIIVDSMRLIIGRELGDSCELYSAYSGDEALTLILRENVDVVFTDILMPGMNGLELIRQVQEAGKEPVFVLITAYDDFDYAQKALGLGAIDYILKPINKTIVLDCVKRALRILDEARSQSSRMAKYEEQQHKLLPFIESRLIDLSLYGVCNPAELSYCCSLLEMDVTKGTAVCISCDDARNIEKIIQYIKAKVSCVSGKTRKDMAVLLFPDGNEPEPEERHKYLENLLERAQETFDRQKIHFEYGIGKPYDGPEGIRISYEQAREKMETATPSCGAWLDSHEFAGLLMQGSEKSIVIFEGLFDLVCKKHGFDLKQVKKALLPVYGALQESSDNLTVQERALLRETCLEEISSLPVLRSWYVSVIGMTCRRNQNAYTKNSDQIVERVSDYIRKHFSDSLMLDELTQRFNYSTAYLSHIFHKKCGITLSDYITNVRLERANELLTDPARSIQEVAETVGYSNSNYFSRRYKKKYGITPTEYVQKQRETTILQEKDKLEESKNE